MQYHAIPCNTMQYNAMPCNTWTGSPPDFRSQAGDQCPEKVGMKLFWVLHASDARRWGSVIHIWNSACLRILLVQLNLDLVNPVQHRDSLKVARVLILLPPRFPGKEGHFATTLPGELFE